MRIYTITLNPAYDVHAYTTEFTPFHENLASVTSRQAGGKGVNISRALIKNGTKSIAVIVLGKDNCVEFREELTKDGIESIVLEKPGRIRENLTLHCADQPETRISFSGFQVDDSLLDDVTSLMHIDSDTVITFTGRVASGMSIEKVKTFLLSLKKKGAKIVLDSKSFSIDDICDLKPWLIKPNQEEISEYLNCSIGSVEEAAEKSTIFCQHGIENVIISMGEQGAVLLHSGKTYFAKPPVVKAVSTIGAGDSSIAGFLAAASQGLDAASCLRLAVAYGTAACLTEGTLPPEPETVKEIHDQTKLY